LRNCL
jgi:hypothetical protein